MPHFGQSPGVLCTTSGCILQVYLWTWALPCSSESTCLQPTMKVAAPASSPNAAMIDLNFVICCSFEDSSPSVIFSCGFSGGLEHLIVLRSGDAFLDQSLIIASPFVILIVAGSHWHFMSG